MQHTSLNAFSAWVARIQILRYLGSFKTRCFLERNWIGKGSRSWLHHGVVLIVNDISSTVSQCLLLDLRFLDVQSNVQESFKNSDMICMLRSCPHFISSNTNVWHSVLLSLLTWLWLRVHTYSKHTSWKQHGLLASIKHFLSLILSVTFTEFQVSKTSKEEV